MLTSDSRKKLESDMAETLRQMAIITDTIANSLRHENEAMYSESEIKSIHELKHISYQLSSTLATLVTAFSNTPQITTSDAQLAFETIGQCKEFITALQPHLLAD
jgi:hypothetical protein